MTEYILFPLLIVLVVIIIFIINLVFEWKLKKEYLQLENDLKAIHLKTSGVSRDKIKVQYTGFFVNLENIDYN